MLVITPVIKFPERKIKSLLLDKWKNMTEQILFSEENSFNYLASKSLEYFRQSGGQEIGENYNTYSL